MGKPRLPLQPRGLHKQLSGTGFPAQTPAPAGISGLGLSPPLSLCCWITALLSPAQPHTTLQHRAWGHLRAGSPPWRIQSRAPAAIAVLTLASKSIKPSWKVQSLRWWSQGWQAPEGGRRGARRRLGPKKHQLWVSDAQSSRDTHSGQHPRGLRGHPGNIGSGTDPTEPLWGHRLWSVTLPHGVNGHRLKITCSSPEETAGQSCSMVWGYPSPSGARSRNRHHSTAHPILFLQGRGWAPITSSPNPPEDPEARGDLFGECFVSMHTYPTLPAHTSLALLHLQHRLGLNFCPWSCYSAGKQTETP